MTSSGTDETDGRHRLEQQCSIPKFVEFLDTIVPKSWRGYGFGRLELELDIKQDSSTWAEGHSSIHRRIVRSRSMEAEAMMFRCGCVYESPSQFLIEGKKVLELTATVKTTSGRTGRVRVQ